MTVKKMVVQMVGQKVGQRVVKKEQMLAEPMVE